MAKDKNSKGVSLAKGPVLLIGLALLIFGVLALLVGGATGFTADPPSGTVSGTTFLGLEVNGWSSLLFIAAGALLVFGSPLQWGAKATSILVGLALGAAAVLALINNDSALGIFAANGLTEFVWGAVAVLLLLLALLPRVGGKKQHDDHGAEQARSTTRVERQPRRVEREPPREREIRFGRETDDSSRARREGGGVGAPASGPTPESRDTTRRQRDGEL